MNRVKGFSCLLCLWLLSAGVSGCAVVAAGAIAGGGTYAYISGWGQQNMNSDISEVFDAALDACAKLDLPVESQSRSLSDASIKAHDGDTPVWISLESVNINVTEVKVRVGLMGDKAATERVMQAIRARL